MKPPAIRSQLFVSPMMQKGPIVAFSAQGIPLVRALGVEVPIECDILDTGMGVPEYQLGETVAFILYDGDHRTGCILGRVTTPGEVDTPVRRRSLRLEVNQFEVTARDRATVQTANARLRLTREGDLEMLARTLIARARRLQKLLAPILRLN